MRVKAADHHRGRADGLGKPGEAARQAEEGVGVLQPARALGEAAGAGLVLAASTGCGSRAGEPAAVLLLEADRAGKPAECVPERSGRELQQHALEDWMEEGNRALGVMDKHLALNDFFVAGHYTIADIALYAYTHVAPQCGYDLAPFPAIRAWLDRVVHQPDYVPMEFRPAAAVPAV